MAVAKSKLIRRLVAVYCLRCFFLFLHFELVLVLLLFYFTLEVHVKIAVLLPLAIHVLATFFQDTVSLSLSRLHNQ